MLTKKGSSIASLVTFKAENNVLVVHKPKGFSHEGFDGIVNDISKIIQEEKRGYKTLENCVHQIELHIEHLCSAYDKLVTTYANMMTPQTRTSSKEKARSDMLALMPDKMLRQFAEVQGIDVSDIILPDDRERLERLITEKME